MKALFDQAQKLLRDWKCETYVFGVDDAIYDHVGNSAQKIGKRALLVTAGLVSGWVKPILEKVQASLSKVGLSYDVVQGARANAPREDVYRIALAVSMLKPDCIVAIGGGSTIDAAKAASALASFTPKQKIQILGTSVPDASSIEPFFGVDRITEIAKKSGRKIVPIIAVQTAAGSSAHLTKYANVTDPVKGIKKLQIDYAIVPAAAVFDFRDSMSSSNTLKIDGALDGIAHCWEVFMGATGKAYYQQIHEIATIAIELIVRALPQAIADSNDLQAHRALGLGTDLGGYAIMIQKKKPQTGAIERGGTNGGHLGSFQLTDYLTHGRACALLNPYYTVLFARAIESQCRAIGGIYQKYGYINSSVDLQTLPAEELALAVAKGMIAFSQKIKFPTSLKDAGVPQDRIAIMVEQSENPQLASKLQNMPIPMQVDQGHVRTYIRPTLQAAYTGKLTEVPVA